MHEAELLTILAALILDHGVVVSLVRFAIAPDQDGDPSTGPTRGADVGRTIERCHNVGRMGACMRRIVVAFRDPFAPHFLTDCPSDGRLKTWECVQALHFGLLFRRIGLLLLASHYRRFQLTVLGVEAKERKNVDEAK
jgi:hypothetical protein